MFWYHEPGHNDIHFTWKKLSCFLSNQILRFYSAAERARTLPADGDLLGYRSEVSVVIRLSSNDLCVFGFSLCTSMHNRLKDSAYRGG